MRTGAIYIEYVTSTKKEKKAYIFLVSILFANAFVHAHTHTHPSVYSVEF